MYLPAHFAPPDATAMHELVRCHPLATLVTRDDDGFTADHLPLELDLKTGPHGTLRGHVARANPLWARADGQTVLVVFQGPDHYVSPSWYPSKSEHHKVVPTWNYQVVHAHGRLRAIDDADWLRALVARLTDQHEAPLPTPWSVDDAPADFVAQMLKAIVGVEIELTKLEGKFKWSQNRSAADRAGVQDGLIASRQATWGRSA